MYEIPETSYVTNEKQSFVIIEENISNSVIYDDMVLSDINLHFLSYKCLQKLVLSVISHTRYRSIHENLSFTYWYLLFMLHCKNLVINSF